MADQNIDRDLAQLMGAHLLALSKATAVYQAELAKVFLGLEEEEDREEAGPAYKLVRDLEKIGLSSSLFDQSPDAAARRIRSWSAGNAALMESWMELLGQPWQAYWRNLSGGTADNESDDS